MEVTKGDQLFPRMDWTFQAFQIGLNVKNCPLLEDVH